MMEMDCFGRILNFPFALLALAVAANSYELNNLDNEALDAPVYNAIYGSLAHQYSDVNNQDFTSLPCETFLVACRTENDLLPGGDSFRHKNPLYQSAHVPSATAISEDNGSETGKNGGKYEYKLKWYSYTSWCPHRPRLRHNPSEPNARINIPKAQTYSS